MDASQVVTYKALSLACWRTTGEASLSGCLSVFLETKKIKRTMKKEFNIYDISSGDGVFIQTVKREVSARKICRQHNQNGERNYMYLQSYE
jgi:hypothetical protein